MAEDSGHWTTDGTGDGAAGGYTMAELTQWFRMLWLNDPDTEGVALGFLNDLEVTDIGGRNLQIDTGGAVVYGYPYWNTSAVTKGLTHPVVGTTGWRLVLRASWVAQTVRITLLEAADGAPAPPDAVHNSGVTWDISIAYGTITTGDVVSITDDRHYLAPNIDVIANLAAHIAATTGIHGAVSAETASKVVIRDASARARFADPAAAQDAATKAYVDAHAALATAGTHGSTTAATANKLVHRDAAGRAKVVAPSAADDIALKSTVTTDIATHAALATVGTHGSTADPTANKLVHRDASGRAAVAAPSAADDIARKDTVDAVTTALNTHKGAALLDHPDDSIDDTKVGNRVPALTRRQGGSATEWDVSGANSYTPTAVRMQVGCKAAAFGDTSQATIQFNFPIAFSYSPLVVLSLATSVPLDQIVRLRCVTASASSCTIVYCREISYPGDPLTIDINWLAIGPE